MTFSIGGAFFFSFLNLAKKPFLLYANFSSSSILVFVSRNFCLFMILPSKLYEYLHPSQVRSIKGFFETAIFCKPDFIISYLCARVLSLLIRHMSPFRVRARCSESLYSPIIWKCIGLSIGPSLKIYLAALGFCTPDSEFKFSLVFLILAKKPCSELFSSSSILIFPSRKLS